MTVTTPRSHRLTAPIDAASGDVRGDVDRVVRSLSLLSRDIVLPALPPHPFLPLDRRLPSEEDEQGAPSAGLGVQGSFAPPRLSARCCAPGVSLRGGGVFDVLLGVMIHQQCLSSVSQQAQLLI